MDDISLGLAMSQSMSGNNDDGGGDCNDCLNDDGQLDIPMLKRMPTFISSMDDINSPPRKRSKDGPLLVDDVVDVCDDENDENDEENSKNKNIMKQDQIENPSQIIPLESKPDPPITQRSSTLPSKLTSMESKYESPTKNGMEPNSDGVLQTNTHIINNNNTTSSSNSSDDDKMRTNDNNNNVNSVNDDDNNNKHDMCWSDGDDELETNEGLCCLLSKFALNLEKSITSMPSHSGTSLPDELYEALAKFDERKKQSHESEKPSVSAIGNNALSTNRDDNSNNSDDDDDVMFIATETPLKSEQISNNSNNTNTNSNMDSNVDSSNTERETLPKTFGTSQKEKEERKFEVVDLFSDSDDEAKQTSIVNNARTSNNQIAAVSQRTSFLVPSPSFTRPLPMPQIPQMINSSRNDLIDQYAHYHSAMWSRLPIQQQIRPGMIPTMGSGLVCPNTTRNIAYNTVSMRSYTIPNLNGNDFPPLPGSPEQILRQQQQQQIPQIPPFLPGSTVLQQAMRMNPGLTYYNNDDEDDDEDEDDLPEYEYEYLKNGYYSPQFDFNHCHRNPYIEVARLRQFILEHGLYSESEVYDEIDLMDLFPIARECGDFKGAYPTMDEIYAQRKMEKRRMYDAKSWKWSETL
eukprot:TRINITY_DN446_c0_g4_i1.p1 TRINITY_DN446_c0_g4~~TRINITY_DN446_c0_g4_i1.p1  ORF type:complete len:632 (+),score=220.09 TRINITY_DN446_c0_g4_i1:188-2083(+)